MTISVDAEPLKSATPFLYLVRTVTFNNNDWFTTYQNFQKARRWWGVVAKMSKMTGEKVRGRAMLYKVVVQTVFLYGNESWVVT